MFQITVDFRGHLPNKKHYSKMAIDQIYEYLSCEARLIITYEDKIIFSEEVAIIEFYWYLLNWYNQFKGGRKIPFKYTTVEYVAPILVFSVHGVNCWEIDSIWKCCDEPIIIDNMVFFREIDKLIGVLYTTLEC